MFRDKVYIFNVLYINIYCLSISCFVSVEEMFLSKFLEFYIELCLWYEVGVKNFLLFLFEF